MSQRFRKRCALVLIALALGLTRAACAAAVLTVTVADNSGRPIENAVVYAVPSGAAGGAAKNRAAVVNQLDREFVPFVTAVQVGTAVRFPNNDPMLHHVYSFSPAKTFQIKLNADTAGTSILFDKAGVVALGCNIHDWMEAYIFVVDSPYFAQTDARGVARIANIAQGDYDVAVWHPYQRGGVGKSSIRAKVENGARASLTVDISTPRRKPKPPVEKDTY